jgi:hypothetical protein
MMAHTPGPWGYDTDSKEVFSRVEEHGCGWIALVEGNDSDDCPLPDGMRLANARLIAAAPALLGCCIELLEMAAALNASTFGDWAKYQHRLGVLISARAVIEGATGVTLNKEDRDVYAGCLERRAD